jgi:hypothetical protein
MDTSPFLHDLQEFWTDLVAPRSWFDKILSFAKGPGKRAGAFVFIHKTFII